MNSMASIELPKLPYDIDGWNIQPALHDVSGWMHASKNKARPLDDVDKSADRVFGIRTHDCRMVGSEVSIELWRQPISSQYFVRTECISKGRASKASKAIREACELKSKQPRRFCTLRRLIVALFQCLGTAWHNGVVVMEQFSRRRWRLERPTW